MSDNNYLKFFIEEEVYVLPGDTISESTTTAESESKPVEQPVEKTKIKNGTSNLIIKEVT